MTVRRVSFDIGPDTASLHIGSGFLEAAAHPGYVDLGGYFGGDTLEVTPGQLETWAATLRALAKKARKLAAHERATETKKGCSRDGGEQP